MNRLVFYFCVFLLSLQFYSCIANLPAEEDTAVMNQCAPDAEVDSHKLLPVGIYPHPSVDSLLIQVLEDKDGARAAFCCSCPVGLVWNADLEICTYPD